MAFNYIWIAIVFVISTILSMTKVGKLITAISGFITALPFIIKSIILIMSISSMPTGDTSLMANILVDYITEGTFLLVNLSIPMWIGLGLGIKITPDDANMEGGIAWKI